MMRAPLCLGLLLLACCRGEDSEQPAVLGELEQGVATFYAATGEGACSYEASPQDLNVAAMNAAQYAGSAACGTCLRVTGPRGSVQVRVVDKCPGCASGHLDLSREAFAKVADPAAGRVAIQWQPVSCSVSGPLSFRFKEGSSQWWTALQVLDHRLPVRALEARRDDGRWVTLARKDYNYFVSDAGLGPGPYMLRVTASDGQQVIEEGIGLRESGVVQGRTQFD